MFKNRKRRNVRPDEPAAVLAKDCAPNVRAPNPAFQTAGEKNSNFFENPTGLAAN